MNVPEYQHGLADGARLAVRSMTNAYDWRRRASDHARGGDLRAAAICYRYSLEAYDRAHVDLLPGGWLHAVKSRHAREDSTNDCA